MTKHNPEYCEECGHYQRSNSFKELKEKADNWIKLNQQFKRFKEKVRKSYGSREGIPHKNQELQVAFMRECPFGVGDVMNLLFLNEKLEAKVKELKEQNRRYYDEVSHSRSCANVSKMVFDEENQKNKEIVEKVREHEWNSLSDHMFVDEILGDET